MNKKNKISASELPTQNYFNRDLSWLEFNRRVLFQAQDPSHPLLERVRFLSIFSSNLDEFFMKRVGYLKRMVDQKIMTYAVDGLSFEQILVEIHRIVTELQKDRAHCFKKQIMSELTSNGIELLNWKNLSAQEIGKMKDYFKARVFPVLTPLAVDPSHPFPFISNMSVSLGIKLHAPDRDHKLFARLKIPNVLPQWIRIDENTGDYPIRMVRLIEIIENNLEELFPEMIIENVMPFRVTRSADIKQVFDEDSEDLLEVVEEELRQRRLANIVRLEHAKDPDPWMIELLQDELEVDEIDQYHFQGEINYRDLEEIANLKIPHLTYKSWAPATHPKLSEDNTEDIFRTISEGDLLVHHPYYSFSTSVERFIRASIEDPKVLAIKMTVYRTGDDSPFIPLLIEAAEKGKQVVCVVEVKARFDEAQNLYWAEKLENVGVHVVYGVVGLKTHTKVALVVRQENNDFKFYAHIGTGNYNSKTAKVYTDLGLFTCNPEITKELIEIFNYLTGLSLKRNYQKFLVSPINMRQRFLELINNEIENSKKEKPARIILKMNSLEDQTMCEALYMASQKGVKIDLIVRGFCSLKPLKAGLSENIRVISTVGRFLEHSRIFYFQNGAEKPETGLFFIGSADWMFRNLNNRVETVVPLEDKAIKKECWQILNLNINDTFQTWQLDDQGNYILLRSQNTDSTSGIQEQLINLAKQKAVLL